MVLENQKRQKRLLISDKSEDSGSEDSHDDSGRDTSQDEKDVGEAKKARKVKVKYRGGRGKLQYKCVGFWREDHNQPLYGVSVNSALESGDPNQPLAFATVGFNRVTIYETTSSTDEQGIRLLQCYADPDPQENFYTCAWSYDSDTRKPILAAGGARGIIRVFSTASMACTRQFVGHGNAINEVKFHPVDPNLLLSVSKDHALRLWNVKTEHNIAIFGGVEGHRDEVLSADFNIAGTKIISSGMDHSLKVWKFDTENIQTAISLSYTHDVSKTKATFPTSLVHFPDFSTRDVHRNYVDCCRWFGDFVLSKSCENSIVCWKPGLLHGDNLNTSVQGQAGGAEKSDFKTTVIHKLEVKDCEIWFIRFCLEASGSVLALGNQVGRVYVWDLGVNDPQSLRHSVLAHPKCGAAVRQTSLSKDGDILLAVCDDGTIWRWDRIK